MKSNENQWENEIEIPDKDHSKAHGQHLLQRRKQKTLMRPSNQQTQLTRRMSHDFISKAPCFIIDVESTKKQLLQQEDTDNNYQITVLDKGPKLFKLGTFDSEGYRTYEVRGTYRLSNLLQELELASSYGRTTIVLDEERLNENPLERLGRLIKYNFWDQLTRRIDLNGLERICNDPKNRSHDHSNRIYVPFNDDFALGYYQSIAKDYPHLHLVVEQLPLEITPEYVKSINTKPGILSLGLRKENDNVRGIPFVVPGGRFNEMYGWDSYFESLGLIHDGRIELARGMVENFWYELEHYNKILNANRSYYLTRSQPPFLTDMTLRVYKNMLERPKFVSVAHDWILTGIKASIKELFGVWLAKPRIDPNTGLSTYHGEGIGIPPETEPSHFDHILAPFAKLHGMDIQTFTEKYQSNEIHETFLDEYFVHDRSVRESGHDTTYRFEKKCANLATIDLNSLLFKYENDLFDMINEHCLSMIEFQVRRGKDDLFLSQFETWAKLVNDLGVEKALKNGWDTFWSRGMAIMNPYCRTGNDAMGYAARNECKICYRVEPDCFYVSLPAKIFQDLGLATKETVIEKMWSNDTKLFYDWDISLNMKSCYKSATTTWALWAGLVSQEMADEMIPQVLKHFKFAGGLVSGTEESRGHISLERPNRQWDYPFGWAPHQMLAWEGFLKYGYESEAREIAYRWLYSIVKSFVGFNGVVPEKFDVVNVSHLVHVEYGNVGVDFKGVAREGFGWMNASFQVGLELLDKRLYRLLANVTHPDTVFKE